MLLKRYIQISIKELFGLARDVVAVVCQVIGFAFFLLAYLIGAF